LLKKVVLVLADGSDCEDGCICCCFCGEGDPSAPPTTTCSNTNNTPSVSPVAAYLATSVVTLLTPSILPAACCFARNNNDRAKGPLGFSSRTDRICLIALVVVS
jgi:hypothetical protein